ncbi:mannose-1-phosphate guanyltransferase [Megalops cyprinoides]|uniref:mannose-1-phosphate guanyltransferase n=1 Tax=Megalops cyprinoides TaxID=118141 RepID=UPI001863C956|nr:mannose-1-phosphate guanyltransferase [Megalops cyprinoides]
MKAIVLAAGYGTRLQRDIENDTTGRFRHLVGTPKPLLPVGHCALISHWVQALNSTGYVDAIFVVTNDLYYKIFEDWAQSFPNVKILNDGTQHNEERLGAVACLRLTVKHFRIDDHIVVIGGDTLFKEDFSLSRITNEFSSLIAKCDDSNLVLSYQCKDEETLKYGILEVDKDLRVSCMKEKPHPSETNSRRACPCFYLFSKATLPLLDVFLDEKKKAPIEEKDAPGNFLSWLILRKPIYVHEVSGRFDVGNLPSYVECDTFFRENLSSLNSYLK